VDREQYCLSLSCRLMQAAGRPQHTCAQLLCKLTLWVACVVGIQCHCSTANCGKGSCTDHVLLHLSTQAEALAYLQDQGRVEVSSSNCFVLVAQYTAQQAAAYAC
jgi:hypothetical protein